MSGLRQLVPSQIRRAAGRVRGTVVRREVRSALVALARSERPIIVGPWLGEVGFEILYWVPFLRWMSATFDLSPGRIIALSRGGPASWYADVAGRYIDVFDHVTIDAFRDGNQRRQIEVGEQKQVREAQFDREIVALIQHAEKLHDAVVLHPSLMYRLYQPYWWKHAGADWVTTHASYRVHPRPSLPRELGLATGEYFAVKFYYNDCVPDDDATRQHAAAVMRELARVAPVVSLSTDLALDDHAGAREQGTARVRSIAPFVTGRTNLSVQTAVVANARAFVGTYGGFSYLAPLHHVRAVGLYALEHAFDRSHLVIAQRAGALIGAPPFDVRSLYELPPETLAERLAA